MFYKITEKVRDILQEDINVNTVSYGSILDAPTDKLNMYPISHFIVNSVSYEENLFRYNMSVVCMDLIDQVREQRSSLFEGNNNEHDILNTQLTVAENLVRKLKKSNLREEGYVLDGNVSIEPFTHRFKHDVAGWVVTFDILSKTDLKVC